MGLEQMSSKILPLNITQTQDKKCFPLRIFSVNVQNVTKFAENCGFGYINGKNPSCKTSVFVHDTYTTEKS